MSFIIVLVIMIALNYGLSFILSQFIASAVLINMIVDLIVAFIYPIFLLPPPLRRTFYKSHLYYRLAGIFALVFLASTCILELIF